MLFCRRFLTGANSRPLPTLPAWAEGREGAGRRTECRESDLGVQLVFLPSEVIDGKAAHLSLRRNMTPPQLTQAQSTGKS